MFTDEFLRLRVSPQPVADRAISVIYAEDDDEMRDADLSDRDQISSWACQIVYIDTKGVETERQITCSKLDGYGAATHIQAYCHSRERPRTFKIASIQELMDLSTGEVVDAFEAAITAYALRFGGDDAMIEGTLRRSPAIAPDGRDVMQAVKRLRSSPIGKQASRLILDHCSLIMDADGRHHRNEIRWAVDLSDALKANIAG